MGKIMSGAKKRKKQFGITGIFLSEKQVKYLERMDTIEVLCVDDDAPYIYQRAGKAAGMIVSVPDHFAENFDGTVHCTFCSNALSLAQMPYTSAARSSDFGRKQKTFRWRT